ncbi:hypothetical protein D3C72_1573980 [compost metagenome]
MEQRQGEQPAAIAIEGDQGGRAPGRGEVVGEAVHHGLGAAAGSRGEDHVARPVGIQPQRLGGGLPLGLELQLQPPPGAGWHLSGRPAGDHLELSRQLGLSDEGEGGIERAEDEAAAHAGPGQQHILQGAAHHGGEAITRLQSCLCQLLAQAV